MAFNSPNDSPAPSSVGSVAIVHDYLNQPGGAERVVLEMAAIWPQAPIFTSLYRPDSTFPEFRDHDVRTSPLDRLPVDAGFRNLFPLYPAAFRAFGTLSQDVVISSSSGWAHSVRTAPESFHAVYCYTPARWLYADDHLGASRRKQMLKPAISLVRRWDHTAARRADLYIAISNAVRDRIKLRYGLDAPVVYPPVSVERFTPSERGERLLVVSRLLPYKRVDVIVDAATKAGIGLDVVGTGPALGDLQRRAGPTVTFHGRLPDADITTLMESCRALCLPGKEDFGITPVEANAAGKPVVALGDGGALETIEDDVSGAFFQRHDATDVLRAIDRCDAIETAPDALAAMARRFSVDAFRSRLVDVIESGAESFRAAPRAA
ncbi:glycosyltransferase [Aromatoleum sp.]|uniref:glycosyltransferase n=1 Tax=Aromatoleum sp. TaxID=2307007 RepID=UPI002FCA3B35